MISACLSFCFKKFRVSADRDERDTTDHILNQSQFLSISHIESSSPACCDSLAKRDPTIVGWNTLVPIRFKILLPQSFYSVLAQIPILKTTAGKDDPFHANLPRDRYDHFDQHIVKFC